MTTYQVITRINGIKTIVEQGLERAAAAKVCISTAMDWRYHDVDNHAGKYYIDSRGKQFGYNLRWRGLSHGRVEMVEVTI